MRRVLLTAVLVMGCSPCAPGTAKAVFDVGVLTCTLGETPGAASSDVPAGAPTRDALCAFKPESGAEETYAGRIEGVNISTEQRAAIIWVVKSASGAPPELGSLAQVYVADPKPPLIGEANSELVLHSMQDRREEAASKPTGFVALTVELKLKSAAG